MRSSGLRLTRRTPLLDLLGGKHGNRSCACGSRAFAEKACLLCNLWPAHHFCHLHEECPDLRCHVGDCPPLRTGEVVFDPTCIFWSAWHAARRVPVLKPVASALPQ